MRKYDSLIHMKEMGLNVGELKEFEYSQRTEMLEYAHYLFDKFGGLIVRTDHPKHINKKPVRLPYITDCRNFEQFEEFIEEHKEKLTYILLQIVGNEKMVFAAYVYLYEMNRLCGEYNDVDRVGDMRPRMENAKNLKRLCVGPCGDHDSRFMKIRNDLIRAGIEPHRIVELAAFDIDGVVTPFYKQLRGKDF